MMFIFQNKMVRFLKVDLCIKGSHMLIRRQEYIVDTFLKKGR